MQTTDGGETWQLWDQKYTYHIGASLAADITIDPTDPNIVIYPFLTGLQKVQTGE